MTAHDPSLHPAIAPLAGPAESEAGGLLTIDLAAIAANWKKLSGMTVPVECAAVVKADAYGCGLEPVARKLLEAGCRTFFVADLTEGRRLRAIALRRISTCSTGSRLEPRRRSPTCGCGR